MQSPGRERRIRRETSLVSKAIEELIARDKLVRGNGLDQRSKRIVHVIGKAMDFASALGVSPGSVRVRTSLGEQSF